VAGPAQLIGRRRQSTVAPGGRIVTAEPERMETAGRARRGASVIVIRGGAVLMVERGRPPFAGDWSFPGGRQEPGEAPAATARRELQEETGITVGAFVSLGPEEPVGNSPFLLSVFAARGSEAEPVACDDAKAAAYVPFGAVLERPRTARVPGWIARALIALAKPPLL
jgi:8-oxo-dGTP diphosphatase